MRRRRPLFTHEVVVVGRRPRFRLALGLLAVLLAIAATVLPISASDAAGPNQYGPPEWFPLRGSWVIGCTWNNGCSGGYHGYAALDIARNTTGSIAGDSVYSAGRGLATVWSSGSACGSTATANAVQVDHGNGVKSYYYHLGGFAISGPTWVDENTVIGYVGHTGNVAPCSFNHLHFEVRVNGARVTPGQLKACRGTQLTSYPAALGVGGWPNVPLWSTVSSDGPGCASTGTSSSRMGFQANTGNMYFQDGASGPANTRQGMMAGTSPAIAALPGGGYEMAFQANTGNLFVWGDAGAGDTGQGMMPGTSPTIAASPRGGYRVGFQANTGNMYYYDSASGAANTQQGMKTGTSPAIAALPTGGYQMAFQANTGNLFVWGDAAKGDTGQGMMAGTSPGIGSFGAGGYRVGFQANTGNLYSYDSVTGPANTRQGMMAGTSPSVGSR